MAKKYKFGLLIVGFLFLFSIVLFLSYKKYLQKLENSNSLVLVENGLSINFLNGNQIILDDENETYSFSIINNNSEKILYRISLNNKNMEKDIKYDLIEKNNKLNILQNELNGKEENLIEGILIEPNETHSYTLKFYESIENFSSILSIKTEESETEYIATTIQNNNEIKSTFLTEPSVEEAIENEGLIESEDDHGTFYYFRGKVENNYVFFADYLWRIVRINNDGSIKLILDTYTESTGNFYNANEELSIENKMDFSQNKMSELLNAWYKKHLEKYEKYLISSRFCVDDAIYNNENKINYYLGHGRLLKDFSLSYNCLGKSYSSKIGLLSADEVVLAGATTKNANTDYYLHVPNKLVSWWTLTPSQSDDTNITFFEVEATGKIVSNTLGSYYRSLRPVITLTKRISVTGTGTEKDPYLIKM